MPSNLKQPAPVLVYGHPSLRRIAKLVPANYSLPVLKAHAEAMWATLENTGNGTAIAAPQIGLDLRLFIMRKTVSGFPTGVFTNKFYNSLDYRIFINPYLVPYVGPDDKILIYNDGCLSIPHYGHGGVTRYKKFTLRFQELAYVSDSLGNDQLALIDEEIVDFEIKLNLATQQLDDFGWIAQHEIEHLDGKFFVDQFSYDSALNKYKQGDYEAGYATLPYAKF